MKKALLITISTLLLAQAHANTTYMKIKSANINQFNIRAATALPTTTQEINHDEWKVNSFGGAAVVGLSVSPLRVMPGNSCNILYNKNRITVRPSIVCAPLHIKLKQVPTSLDGEEAIIVFS